MVVRHRFNGERVGLMKPREHFIETLAALPGSMSVMAIFRQLTARTTASPYRSAVTSDSVAQQSRLR